MTELSDFQIGQTVELADNHIATVQFVGNTHFAPGDWVGIVFDEAIGKNDGSVQGQRYFDCPAGHGMFIRPTVARILDKPTPKPAARTVGNANGTIKKGIPSSTTDNGLRRPRPVDPAGAKRQSINESSPTPDARVSRLSNTGRAPQRPAGLSPSPGPSTLSRTNTPISRKSMVPPTSSKRMSMAPPPPPTASNRAVSRPSIAGTMNGSVKPMSNTSSTSRGPGSRLSLKPGTRERIGSTSGESRSSLRSGHESPAASLDGKWESPSRSEKGNRRAKEEPNSIVSPLSPVSGLASPLSQASAISGNSQRPRPPRGRSPGVVSQRPTVTGAAQKRQLEDMETKLRMIEKRREEDREKVRELEKVKADRDRYEGIIQKLQTKYQPQQQEMADLKKQLKDAEKAIETLEAKQAENDSINEMATLDKEMAEELADSMRLELQALRQKHEELELEAEILRDENQELGKEISPSEKTSQGWLQLERSNERYREALMRLRDVTQEQEADLRDQILSLETDLQDYNKMKEDTTLTKERIAGTEVLVEDLRQQLDAALGGEEIIEELTEKNLVLNERIEDLRATIEDLEALKELNDELEINHTENEKQLQHEIDYHESLLADEMRKSAVQDGAIQDLEYTVSRFRDLVITLQSDLEDMRSSQQITEAQASELSAKSRAMMDENLKLQNSASKRQIKAIDLELRSMQASESSEHLAIVQHFLPEALHSERDSIQALLRFRRIGFKAKMLHDILKERVSSPSVSGQEDVFSYCNIIDKLTWISSTCSRFISTVETSDTDTFKRFGAASYELEPVERGMNAWIDALRQDELKAIQCDAELPRYIALMAHLAEVHINDNLEHFADYILMRAIMIQSHLENSAAALLCLRSIFEMKSLSFSSGSEEDEAEERELSLQIFSKIDSLVSQARGAKVVSGKAIRQLEDLKSQCITLDPATLPTIEQSEQSGAELVSLAIGLGTSLVKLLEGEEQTEPLTSQKLSAALQSGPIPLSSISSKLQAAAAHLHTFYNLTTSPSQAIEFPVPSPSPPWKRLAQQMKAANADLEAREVEMSRLKDEMSEKSTALAVKDKIAEEMAVKLEVLEKRVGESDGRREKVKELQEAAAGAKAREEELQAMLADLQSELQRAESDRDNWKSTADAKTGSGVLGKPFATSKSTDAPTTSESSLRQISALKSDIKTLQSTIRYLQLTSQAQHTSESLSFLSTPLTPPTPLPSAQSSISIQTEAKSVLKEMLSLLAQPQTHQLVKLHPRAARDRLRWQPARETTTWQVQKQKEEWEEWSEWRDAVAKKAAWSRRRRDGLREQRLPHTAAGCGSGKREARTMMPLARMQIELPFKGGEGGGGGGGGRVGERDVEIVDPSEWEDIQRILEVKVG